MSSVDENEETGEIDYNYADEIGHIKGTAINPLTIKSSQEFNDILTEQGALFNQYVRIVKDFSFDYGQMSLTSSVEFAGSLDGNGMTISNISIVSSSTSDKAKIGLFKSITKNGTSVGLVKNLNLQFSEIFANDTTCVGGLAGVIKNARVYNLFINSASTVVQGKNLVGGVAGKVIGDSHLVNIKSQISVNSSYRKTVSVRTPYYIYDLGNNDAMISYAGAVAGVVDTVGDVKNIETGVIIKKGGIIENISVAGNSSVIGETVGGAIGLIGIDTTANNITVEVVKDQFLRTTKVVGGVVGENREIFKIL